MEEKTYNISILPIFKTELNEMVEYITYKLHNPEAALQLLALINEKIIERSFAAESFEPYMDAPELDQPYYRIKVNNYEILYVVIGNTMEVRRLFYNKRNIITLL